MSRSIVVKAATKEECSNVAKLVSEQLGGIVNGTIMERPMGDQPFRQIVTFEGRTETPSKIKGFAKLKKQSFISHVI